MKVERVLNGLRRSLRGKLRKVKRTAIVIFNAKFLRKLGVRCGELPDVGCGEILIKYSVRTFSGDEVVKWRLWGCGEFNCPVCDFFRNQQAGLKIWKLAEARLKNGRISGFLRIILTFPQPLRERLWVLLNSDRKAFQRLLSRCVSKFYNGLREVDHHNHVREGNGFYVFHYMGDEFTFHPHFEVWFELPRRFPPINNHFIGRLKESWKSVLEKAFAMELDKVNLQVRYFRDSYKLKQAILYSNRSLMVKEEMDLSDEERLKNIFVLRRLTKGMRRRVGFGLYRTYIRNLEQMPEILNDNRIDWKTRKAVALYHIQQIFVRENRGWVEVKDLNTGSVEAILFDEVEWFPLKE